MALVVQAGLDKNSLYLYEELEFKDSIRLIELDPASDRDAELTCTIAQRRLPKQNPKSQSGLKNLIFPLLSGAAARPDPTYEAISYVWGEPIFTETLYSSKGCFKITASLAAALRRFRLANQTRRVWADAVCIDQVNDEEKSNQVAQMGAIYRGASQVLVWLGESTEDTHQALLDVQRLALSAARYHVENKDPDFTVFVGPQLKSSDASGKEEVLTGMRLIFETHEREDLKAILTEIRASKLESLFTLPWFSRLWIIQEVANASKTTLHWGEDTLDWDLFASALRLIVGIVKMPGPSFILGQRDDIMSLSLRRAWHIVSLRTEFKVTSAEGAFCISLYRQFGGNLKKAALHHCSDDRDRLYGLASLCSPLASDRGLSIRPDYQKSTTEVYRDFARQYLSTGIYGDIRVIYDAGLWRRSYKPKGALDNLDYSDVEYLPSWVPEWRPKNLNEDELPWNEAPFNTCWHTAPSVIHDYEANKNVLGLEATFVERVESLLLTLDESVAPKIRAGEVTVGGRSSLHEDSHYTSIIGIIEIARHFSQQFMQNDKYFSGEDGRAALVRTLLAECSVHGISKIMFNVPDSGNEQEMIEVWDRFERCCIRPDGELRLTFELGPDAFQKRIKIDNGDGPRFSEDVKGAMDFMEAVQHVLSRCQFIVTTYGLLALVPKATEQYDQIVRITGTKMPYVIRRLENSEMHVLIGPCYVHGIMHCPTVGDHPKILSIESDVKVIYFV